MDAGEFKSKISLFGDLSLCVPFLLRAVDFNRYREMSNCILCTRMKLKKVENEQMECGQDARKKSDMVFGVERANGEIRN